MKPSQTSAKTLSLQRPVYKMFFIVNHVTNRSMATKTMTIIRSISFSAFWALIKGRNASLSCSFFRHCVASGIAS